MRHVLYRVLPVLLLALTALLTAAAIEFLPETLYFPVVEFSTPEAIRIALFKNGELELSACEQGAAKLATAIRADCAACIVTERCVRGLDAERRQILSREPLAMPSLRMREGTLTMTLTARDPQLALNVCQKIERQSASLPVDERLQCFSARVSR